MESEHKEVTMVVEKMHGRVETVLALEPEDLGPKLLPSLISCKVLERNLTSLNCESALIGCKNEIVIPIL